MIDHANVKAESVFQPGLFAHINKLRQVQCRLGSDTSLNQERVQEKDVKATSERSEQGKARRIEWQEQEATRKRKFLNQGREHIADLDLTASPSTSTSANKEKSEAMVLDEPCVSGERSKRCCFPLLNNNNNGHQNTKQRNRVKWALLSKCQQ